jgi:competence protein ComEC
MVAPYLLISRLTQLHGPVPQKCGHLSSFEVKSLLVEKWGVHMGKTNTETQAVPLKRLALLALALLAAAMLLVALLSTCVSPTQPPPEPPYREGALEVVFLDVGQANAALISSGGHYMLIDGGGRGDSSLIYSVLEARGVSHLDYIIFSHTDSDHVGGLSGALSYVIKNEASVGICYGPATEGDTIAFSNFIEKLSELGKQVTVPDDLISFSFGSATVTIWHLQKNTAETNDNELIVRIVNGNDSFLFTGDIGGALESLLLDVTDNEIESDVLLVPHHGSDSSSSYEFLRTVNPQYSVVSVGGGNGYSLPTEGALSRYRDLGTTLLRTDMHGDITFVSDQSGLRYTTQKPEVGDVFQPGSN